MMLAVVVTARVWVGTAMDDEARGRVDVVIYLTGQEQFYDSVVNHDLPPHGIPVASAGRPEGTLMTEFGPGDRDYVGGRWIMDTSGNGQIEKYFSCPFLGPGRKNP